MPNPILARADALMSRRRQSAESDEFPVLTDVVDDNDNIPILTDFDVEPNTGDDSLPPVDAPALSESPALASQLEDNTPPTPIMASGPSLEEVASELARRIELRIMAELPRLIASTLRDYLAEQEMIANQHNGD